jgi:hypothetical protein
VAWLTFDDSIVEGPLWWTFLGIGRGLTLAGLGAIASAATASISASKSSIKGDRYTLHDNPLANSIV